MKVSEIFHLERDQTALDFVDVDVEKDLPFFVDPRAIRIQEGQWHDQCIALLQTFFHEILISISDNNNDRAFQLLKYLSEPNEVHLGVSRGLSRGRGLGGAGARNIVDALSRSRAAETKMLQDLEDSALLVEDIGPDIVSDITTNVIRGALIGYTQEMCYQYDIPTESDVYGGYVWDEDNLGWHQVYADLPTVNGNLLLLVPKSIVRMSLIHTPDKYYRRAIARRHEAIEKNSPGSSLVYALKNGKTRVNREKLIKKYGNSKAAIIKHTEKYPEALREFRENEGLATSPPISHFKLAEKTESSPPNFRELLESIQAIKPGRPGAPHYHRAIKDFLSAVLYPFLSNVRIEHPIHDGRKRIDINFDNVADSGFFRWISRHHPAAQLVVECKNYTGDPENPELDQLTGRFGTYRTQFGMLVCRKVANKKLFLQRCRDTAKDGRGFVFLLDDEDLEQMIIDYYDAHGSYQLLRDQFDKLVG